MKVTSITVEFECDGHWLVMERPALTITAVDAKGARRIASERGWRFDRTRGWERETCPDCARRERQMVSDGVIDKRGNILDMARWDAIYESVAR